MCRVDRSYGSAMPMNQSRTHTGKMGLQPKRGYVISGLP